jgi:hypothetical protein
MDLGNRTGPGVLLWARARVLAGLLVCGAVDGSEAGPISHLAAPAPSISLSTSVLSFTTAAESTSASQEIKVTNTGAGALRISRITLTGASAASFHQSTTCGPTLWPRQSCGIVVSLTAYLAKSYSADLEIASNAGTAPQIVALTGMGTGALTINTTSPSDWVLTNGALTLHWNSTSGRLFAVYLNGSGDLVDETSSNAGLYMDNVGPGAGTPTAGYSQKGNEYIDWWITVPSNASNAFTTSRHFVLTANDTGFHVYSTADHSATDIAGSIGQWQYVFRINLAEFTNTYTVDEGLENRGVQVVPLPDPAVTGNTDPGRHAQDATVDLHGLPLPTGFTREFFTKYDYSSYEYLHRAHGVFGTTFGAWTVIPSPETLVGGPTKQDLIFTDNILMMEALSNHLDNALGYTAPQGVATNRLFGPYYFHFNVFTAANSTPASLHREAMTWLPEFALLYDGDDTLIGSGYVPSTGRGRVDFSVAGGSARKSGMAWTVLSDSGRNFQLSSAGLQYWASDGRAGPDRREFATRPDGKFRLFGVAPGTYRLSHYLLGQWGELRQDGVVVSANQTAKVAGTFTPENFGPDPPVWTIGTPDRSAHEFLHGHDADGNDLRNYWGAYNYWADFAATNGMQVYYATAVGTTPATNDPTKLNYTLWGRFDPGLFAGIYNPSDDTPDGYIYAIPSYVASLPNSTGTNGVTTPVPGITIHFTTTDAQLAQGQYAVLSVGLACAEASVIATLNGSQRIFHFTNASDCMARSGVSGFYEWAALQWPTTVLNAPGVDNVLTLNVSQPLGVVLDALRMEITATSADPAVTAWHDYAFGDGTTFVNANDAVPNN